MVPFFLLAMCSDYVLPKEKGADVPNILSVTVSNLLSKVITQKASRKKFKKRS